MTVYLYRIEHYQNVTEDGVTYPSITQTWYRALTSEKERVDMLEHYGDINDVEDYYEVTCLLDLDAEYDFPLVLRALQIAEGEIKTLEWEAKKEQMRCVE